MTNRAALESRRLLAEADLRAGMKQADVARKHGVSRQSAIRWALAIRQGKSLRSTKGAGRPRKTDYGLIRELCEEHQGRTGAKLAEEIELATGVRYDVDYVGRLRKRLREKEAVSA